MNNQDSIPNFRSQTQRNNTKKPQKKKQKRKVYDAIHGFIYFPQLVWDFIDTQHFQRLRKIKQLGTLEYVFPTATHTRFEHSIGTAHLAKTFMQKLIQNHEDLYVNVDKEAAILVVTLAGLLHDIGHGPYSHMFDGNVVTEINHHGKPQKWTHEIASEAIFEHMTQLQELKGKLKVSQIQRIKALISGQKSGERLWQFQLISNKINGIDVDKLDYFRRDAFYLGAKNIFIDHQLLMNEARIIDDEICYPSKYVQMVNNIFHSRYKLYKGYYNNTINVGIQHMICDVLDLTKQKFELKRACEEIFTDSRRYLRLNDSIIEKVEDVYEDMKQNQNSSDQKYKDNFEKAIKLIKRLRKRKLYKFVKQLTYYVKQNQYEKIVQIFEKWFKKDKILQKIVEESGVDPALIFVTINDVGYGIKQTNPLKKVGFFRKQQEQPYHKLKEHEIESLSMLYTQTYFQRSIKVYIKEDRPQLFTLIEQAVDRFREKHQQTLKLDAGKLGKTPLANREEKSIPTKSSNPIEHIQI